MNIQWYPGHMTKARRMMEEDIKLIDVIIEIKDARVPFSSANPDIDLFGKGKKRLIILNKADLADEKINMQWKRFYEDSGYSVLLTNSQKNVGVHEVSAKIRELCKEKIERDLRRGIKNRPIRAMICGIPNVGKSTFINSVSKKASTKTGNKPGVTKGKQWISVDKTLELLDTPGILWPKFDDEKVGERLALIGSISDEILNLEELACIGISFFQKEYGDLLVERYHIKIDEDVYDVLKNIAITRKYLLKGEEPDIQRAAKQFLDDLRQGRIGRISLERPEDFI